VIGDHPDRDDLVAFSLGALDPAEEREVEAHASTCARCTRELEALAPAVGVLAESVEQLEAPPELRERVMAEVRADIERTAEVREPRAERARRGRARRGWLGLLLRPATAVGVAIAIAAIGGYLIAGNEGEGGGGATTVAVQPMSPGIGGTLAVGDDASTLEVHGLQQVSGREVYQVWVAKGKSLRPSSDFVPDPSGRATTAVEGQLTSGTTVMVTREPEAGRTTPTPPILLSATVQ
jgi:Anti-sigma-K factor rskA, C-terminal/Putative zinc-finger